MLSLVYKLPGDVLMDALSFADSAFFSSTFAVALAEIGDKTQLLTLFLAIQFRNRLAIVFGIFLSTLVNHGLSAWFGGWLSQVASNSFLAGNWHYLMAAGFLAMAIWLLIPDEDEDVENRWLKYGAFVATLVLFSVAELGDKTQVVTVMLAAQWQAPLTVTAGTTIGMMLANVPVIWFGKALIERMPVKLIHRITAALFAISGVALLFLN